MTATLDTHTSLELEGGKVMVMIIYSKKCSACDISIVMGEEPQECDDCPRNYKVGLSKVMEETAALDLVVELYAMGAGAEFIVSDDDSTMHARLKHIRTHNGGKLPLHVPQPAFLCNPLHRVEVMAKEIFNIALASKKQSECEIDALRLKKYVGCYITKKSLTVPELQSKSKCKSTN